jgi:hypothetical protein
LKIFNPFRDSRIPMAPAATALLLASLGSVEPAAGQNATLRVPENFRVEPQGQVIARLEAGTPLFVHSNQGGWLRASVTGWVWAQSLQTRSGGSFDFRVSSEGGENLRDGPQGSLMGRLSQGTLLEELEREPGWIRVRRTAWIWAQSVALDADAPADPRAEAEPPDAPSPELESQRAAERSSAGEAPPGDQQPEWIRPTGDPLPVLTSPDGDTLALALTGRDVRVVDREGSWARVRIDGWVWAPQGQAVAEDEDAVLTSVTPDLLREDPDAYRGRIVSWELQFISVERAEQIRTDFYEGEPFILTRFGGEGGSFVYVAFPPDRLTEVRSLTPLERISVIGRVRVGSAALTGNPILDLLELRRVGP